MQITMVHEVLHCVNRVSAIDMSIGDQDKDGLEEWLVEVQCAPLTAVLRSNPVLVRWLTWKEL